MIDQCFLANILRILTLVHASSQLIQFENHADEIQQKTNGKREATLFMNMNINDYREKPTCHVISVCIGTSECISSKILISY